MVLATCGMAAVDVQVVLLVLAACEIVLAECVGVLFDVSCMWDGSSGWVGGLIGVSCM